MNEALARSRAWLVPGVAAVLLAVAAWWTLRPTETPVIAGWPTPEELDSLVPYLAPVAAAPRIDDYGAFLPAATAPAPAAPRPAPLGAPAPEWRLSAVLITGDRPIAIIDDAPVGLGARLPDGSVVVAIEREQVVLRAPDGTRRTLRLSPEAGPGLDER